MYLEGTIYKCKLGFSTQASQNMDIVIVCYGVS